MDKDKYIFEALNNGNILVDVHTGYIYSTGFQRRHEKRKLKGSQNASGYLQYMFKKGSKDVLCLGHRLVWIAANGIPPKNYVVDHINNNKTDNRIENLQILTFKENVDKAVKENRMKRGFQNYNTKVSPLMYSKIREMYATGQYPIRALALQFGASKARISEIINHIKCSDPKDNTTIICMDLRKWAILDSGEYICPKCNGKHIGKAPDVLGYNYCPYCGTRLNGTAKNGNYTPETFAWKRKRKLTKDQKEKIKEGNK